MRMPSFSHYLKNMWRITMSKKPRQSQRLTRAKSNFRLEKEYNEKLVAVVAEYTETVNAQKDDLLKWAYQRQLDGFQKKLDRSNKRLPMYQALLEEALTGEEFGLN